MKKTWGEIKKEVLGLMFSNYSGTSPVPLTDSSVAEYVYNMPEALGFAFADLSEACPYVIEKNYTLPLLSNTIDLKDEFDGFIRLLDSECVLTEDGDTTRFDDFYLHGDNLLTLNAGTESGVITLTAVCAPYVYKDGESSDADIIDYPRKALTAATYYMAHRLYLEDDIQIAMQYLNFYYTLKEELKKFYSRDGFGFLQYTNKAGWL